jgi:DNA-binding response OmpR family regulator
LERDDTVSKWIPVLVVDDDEIVRKAMTRSLKLYGFEVYPAQDGPTGLKLARSKKPALILLDWMMPETDGLEVLAELKHNQKTEHIPVFMLTSKGMIGDLDQAFEIGADDYITKPLDLTKLGKIVKAKWEKYTNLADVRHGQAVP